MIFVTSHLFLLADIAPDGYAIIFREFGIISERSVREGAINPYGSLDGRKYYAGPMGYFVYINDEYIDVLTKTEISLNDISSAKCTISEMMNKLRDKQQLHR